MRRWIARMSFCLVAVGLAAMVGTAQENEVARANALFAAGKRVDALPLYEHLAKEHPNEMLYAERLADCLGAMAMQTSDAAEVKALLTRQRDAAKRAVELGDSAIYVKDMAKIDPDAPLLGSITGPGKALLAEAEKAYTAGDFPKAMAKYTAAAEADPHLYEAPLYAGDTAFVQKDLNTAAQWFARAIGVDPNRETAYRYWGDALVRLGGDPAEAKEKFIEAVVAEPYNGYAMQGIKQWAQTKKAVLLAPKIEPPPAPVADPRKPGNLTVKSDPATAGDKKQPGASLWLTYNQVRASYQRDQFKKDFPKEKEYRHTLREEHAALTSVAQAIKDANLRKSDLDESLRNLVELNDAGMLDCWILISGADPGIQQDYDAYRKEHRQLLHDYLARFVVHEAQNPAQ